jgi:hypothetical protein
MWFSLQASNACSMVGGAHVHNVIEDHSRSRWPRLSQFQHIRLSGAPDKRFPSTELQ